MKGCIMKFKLNKKIWIGIICVLFVAICLCISGYLYRTSRSVALNKSRLYPYFDKMEMDTSIEKKNNPESCYQTVNGKIYLIQRGNLYKASIGDDRIDRKSVV